MAFPGPMSRGRYWVCPEPACHPSLISAAAKRLSADVINFSAKGSSVSKGESLKDTAQTLQAMGADAVIRSVNGQALVTDNGQYLLDVRGLHITEPQAFEDRVSQWPGVVTVGVFAHQHAHICLLGTPDGVQTIVY